MIFLTKWKRGVLVNDGERGLHAVAHTHTSYMNVYVSPQTFVMLIKILESIVKYVF